MMRGFMTLTRTLAGHVVNTRAGDLPAAALQVAREVVLDGLGVMIAGANEPLGIGRISIDYAEMLGGKPEATVVAGGFKTNVLNAAYANGTMCHALDFDNTGWPLNHPTSPTLPAILALAERNSLGGSDILPAVVLCFEVQGRLRTATARVGAGTGFHKPGVSGTIGAVTAAGRLLGLDVDRMCMAYGIAGSRCGSLSANTGTMTKSSHSGHGARMGAEAALLAEMGFTATDDVFGKGQFFELFYGAGIGEPELLVKDFGKPYWMVDPGIGFKKYPSNYFTHRPIDACLALAAAHRFSPADIVAVEVDFPCFDYVNRPNPKTGLDGKFSVQYATAIALLDRKITIASFSDLRRFAPDAVDMLGRVKLSLREDIPKSFDASWAVVRLRLKDGRLLEERCDKPRGIWGVPLTRRERIDKFNSCVDGALDDADAGRIVELVEGIDALANIHELMDIVGRAKCAVARTPGRKK
jgi:2-methylcitrate dehydratase PrpD